MRIEATFCKYLEFRTGRCVFQERTQLTDAPSLAIERPADFTKAPHKKTLPYCLPWKPGSYYFSASEQRECSEFKGGKPTVIENSRDKRH